MSDLMHLSIRCVGHHRNPVPSPPTNEQRMRAFRAMTPVTFGNAHPWAFGMRERYAREQGDDDTNFNEGFQLKYG